MGIWSPNQVSSKLPPVNAFFFAAKLLNNSTHTTPSFSSSSLSWLKYTCYIILYYSYSVPSPLQPQLPLHISCTFLSYGHRLQPHLECFSCLTKFLIFSYATLFSQVELELNYQHLQRSESYWKCITLIRHGGYLYL